MPEGGHTSQFQVLARMSKLMSIEENHTTVQLWGHIENCLCRDAVNNVFKKLNYFIKYYLIPSFNEYKIYVSFLLVMNIVTVFARK